MRQLRTVLRQYKAEYGRYPLTLDELEQSNFPAGQYLYRYPGKCGDFDLACCPDDAAAEMINDCRYHVRINGRETELFRVNVSAAPINHVWPGFQRSFGQTADAWFCRFELTASTEIEVDILYEDEPEWEIRPSHRVNTVKKTGKTISFKMDEPGQIAVLSGGLQEALHLFADPPFVYELQKNDIFFGPGVHHAGAIMPRSGQTVCIAEGAYVYGAIVVHHAENVRIIGRGVLDSSRIKCAREAVAGESGGEVMAAAASLGLDFDRWYVNGNIVIFGSSKVTVEGIILVDAPGWSLIVRNHSRNILIDNIKIIGQWRYNSDGIDICSSQHVIVKNSFIRSFDDCFVVRGPYLEGEYEDVRDVVVENCVLWCDWGKSLEVWSGERECTISDIRFHNIDMIHVQAVAISVDYWFGSGRSMVKDICYDSLRVCSESFYPNALCQTEDCPDYPQGQGGYLPQLIRISHGFLGKNLGNQQCVEAEDTSYIHLSCRNVIFRNISIQGQRLPVQLKSDPGILEISDIRMEQVEYLELSSGPIKNLIVNENAKENR